MKSRSLFYFISVCMLSLAMVLFLDSPLVFARSGTGGNIGSMPGSGIMLGPGGVTMPINNIWGITNVSVMDYPWTNSGQSDWGNILGMMTNVDAYSGYSDWGGGGGYNMMDLTNIMNQSRDYMDMMNQFNYCSGCYIPPPGQAHIYIGPDKPILPKISNPRWPTPVIMTEGSWPGNYAAVTTGVWNGYF